MPTIASEGSVPVCDGTLTEHASGYLTCSVAWEYVDLATFLAFDPANLDYTAMSSLFVAGLMLALTVEVVAFQGAALINAIRG